MMGAVKDKEEALSRRSDPWSSREVGEIDVDVDLLDEMWRWVRDPGVVRACGRACGYVSDFEVTEAFKPFFKTNYEDEIRRQWRILRDRRRMITVPKEVHRHFNPATKRWAQCHTVRRTRTIPRQ